MPNAWDNISFKALAVWTVFCLKDVYPGDSPDACYQKIGHAEAALAINIAGQWHYDEFELRTIQAEASVVVEWAPPAQAVAL